MTNECQEDYLHLGSITLGKWDVRNNATVKPFARTINQIVESDYNGTFKLWMPQNTNTNEWSRKIAAWWTMKHPTTDLDLAANSNLTTNLTFPLPVHTQQFPLFQTCAGLHW